jgi:hypothetical protein
MKNFKTIIAIMAIGLSTVFSASATDPNPEKKIKTLRTELASFIGKNIPIEINKVTTAEVSFIVNNKYEVIVISINSNIVELDYFLKQKLNYKKITTREVEKGKIYIMPLRVEIQ